VNMRKYIISYLFLELIGIIRYRNDTKQILNIPFLLKKKMVMKK